MVSSAGGQGAVQAMVANELVGDHSAMTSVWRSQCREVDTVWDLRRSRRNLDPHLRTRRRGRIIGLGAGTIIPVRLWLLVHDDGRWLYSDLRGVVVGRIVIRRITPRRTPPWARDDDAVPMKVAVESMVTVPVKP